MWRKENDPGALAGATEAIDVIHPDNLYETDGPVHISVIVAALLAKSERRVRDDAA
jgi:hypothetical protein